jgi:hypothetical protein
MPNTDYSKTIIYVIKCRDDNITEEYIGSTTNFRSRKNQHKSCCNNENDKHHNYKIYKFIRENGGWINWLMLELEKYPCADKREAEYREEEVRLERKTQLNMKRAFLSEENIKKDKKESDKIYREKNKDMLKEKKKIYREKNKDILRETKRIYHEQNKEKIYEKRKEYFKQYNQKKKEQMYYEKNKEKINEQRRQNRAEKKLLHKQYNDGEEISDQSRN